MENNYRIQNGCHNCGNCLVHWPQDDPVSYNCLIGAPPAPKKIPVEELMESKYHHPNAWDYDEWRDDLPEVRAAGICDFWSKKS